MPELPEVETTCRGIQAALEGKIIKRIVIRNPNLRWPIPSAVSKLKNLTVQAVKRRAKYILIITHSGTIIIHLGMSGSLKLVSDNVRAEKHDHADFVLENLCIRYRDPRRFGAILWTVNPPLTHPLLSALGCEPWDFDFTAAYLLQRAKNKKIAVKQFIMDQSVVVGVGNIYANEALFLAKISPLRVTNTLELKEWQILIKTIQQVLKKAIQLGGTTLRDFKAPEGKLGYFSQKLLVYGRGGELCPCCDALLESVPIAKRSTVFCLQCQK